MEEGVEDACKTVSGVNNGEWACMRRLRHGYARLWHRASENDGR
jgi:hypothetical protein